MESQWPAEEVEYLEEILLEYKKYVENIGQNGLAANLVLYYRDELQETLSDLEGRVPTEAYWHETVRLDETLRSSAQTLVQEIGWNAFQLQRESRKPPKEYWWWYLDTRLANPEQPGLLRSWWDWIQNP